MADSTEDTDPMDLKIDFHDLDLGFCELYYKAIKKLLDIDDERNISYFRRYFHLIFDSELDDTDAELLRDCLLYRITDIYRNCSILSSAVAFHLRCLLKEQPSVHGIIHKNVVRICSLRGSAAAEIVAIVSVLESVAQEEGIDIDFRVTIIDRNDAWRVTCYTVLSCLECFANAVWKINFIQADLSEINKKSFKVYPAVVKAIQSADILTMVKFFSEYENHSQDGKRVMERINDIVRHGTLTFFLDIPKYSAIKACGGLLGELRDCQMIYEEVCDTQTLDLAAVRRIRQLFDKKIQRLGCWMQLRVFVRVGLKLSADGGSKRVPFTRDMRFRRRESYNPRQGFLSPGSFDQWEKKLTASVKKMGWTDRGIRIFVTKNKDERNELRMKLLEKSKAVEVARKQLVCGKGAEELSHHGPEIDIDDWKEYLTEKTAFSSLKQTVYSFSLRLLHQDIKRDEYEEYSQK